MHVGQAIMPGGIDMFNKLKKIVIDQLGDIEVNEEITLEGLGADSFDAACIEMDIEEEFDVQFVDQKAQFMKVSEILEYIKEHTEEVEL